VRYENATIIAQRTGSGIGNSMATPFSGKSRQTMQRPCTKGLIACAESKWRIECGIAAIGTVTATARQQCQGQISLPDIGRPKSRIAECAGCRNNGRYEQPAKKLQSTMPTLLFNL